MNLLVDIGNSHLALGYIYLLDRGSTPWCKKNFNSIKYDFFKRKKAKSFFIIEFDMSKLIGVLVYFFEW